MEIKSFILNETKNGHFESIMWHKSMSSMLKRGNPYVGRVSAICVGKNLQMGVSYENKEAKNHEEGWKPDPPKGKAWVMYPKILRSLKDASVEYLRVTTTENTAIKTLWFVDGRVATAAEVAEIKTFFPTRDAVVVFDLKMENVIRLRVDKKEWVREGAESEVAEVEKSLA